MKKIQTCFSIDESINKKLKEIANKEDRSLSYLVNQVLKKFVGDK